MTKPNVLLVGGGNMGRALLGGWRKQDAVAGVTVIDPHPAADLASYTVFADADAVDDSAKFDLVLLAIKPQTFPDVLPKLKKFVSKKTFFLSIAAGKSIAGMEKVLGVKASIVRAMPNTPAMIGQGIAVCVANTNVTPTQKDIAENILKAVGDVVWIADEDHMHAVTALSGSGPAYVFALIEAMQKAGEAMGLDKTLTAQLARQTVIGSAALASFAPDKTPAELRQQVTSPGGTTEAALKILKAKEGLDTLFDVALKSAEQRSRELASET